MASPTGARTLSIATLFCCLAGAAAAQDLDLTGIWRFDSAQDQDEGEPVKAAAPNAENGQHGTYMSLPYIDILRNKQNELHLYSDVGAVRAVLRPVASDPNAYEIFGTVDGAASKVLGVLHVATEMCGSKAHCFQIAGDDLPWQNLDTTLYIPMAPYDSTKDPILDQFYSSNFAPVSSGQGYAAKSYDLRSLDPKNFQTNDPKHVGSGGRLFMDLGPHSYSYFPWPLASDHKLDVPLGWTLKNDDSANGKSWTQTIDTGREMENSDSLEIGVSAKANLLGLNAETSVSVATAQKIQQMNETKSIVAQSDYVSTKYALILNRRRQTLTDDFIGEIKDLKGKAAKDPLYDHVIAHWGTHYANAVTLGSRGFRGLTLNEETIDTLHENKVDVKAALSVIYDGNGGSAEVNAGHEAIASIKKFAGDENVNFTCYGGGHCSPDGVPSGEDLAPIYLDLRPLSDLLAPPFFSGDEEVYGPVRQNLAQRIKEVAYRDGRDLDNPTMSLAAVKVVNPTSGRPQLLCTGDTFGTSVSACCRTSAYQPPLSGGASGAPAVAALTLTGMNPLKRRADADIPDSEWDVEHWRSLDIGDGQTVQLPTSADPTPMVSNVTIDYDFQNAYPIYRNDSNHKLVHWPNIRRYCLAQYGDGWDGNITGQQASCTASSGTHQVDVQSLCNYDADKGGFGSTIAVWNEVEKAWMCGFHSDTSIYLRNYCESIGVANVDAEVYWGIRNGLGPYGRCNHDSDNLDATQVCNDALGRGFEANADRRFDLGSSQINPEALCRGTFAEAREAIGVKEAAILTYPGRTPYDPRVVAVGSTTDVVVPLQWAGDSEKVCHGASIELVIGLQRGANVDPIDAVLSSPLIAGGERRQR
jgi:hypothetical protein